jgi:hypothetical protein
MNSKSSPSPLTELNPDATGPRRVLRAKDRSGESWYFAPVEIGSIAPTRDGSCIRLRGGRMIILAMPPDAVAGMVWKAA